jgi:hypothetical protein
LKQRRAAIYKKENELMVQKSIEGFKDLHNALTTYFSTDIEHNNATPFMRFMFTRFVLRWIAFWRRIEEMIGYTGGQAMDQMILEPEIGALSAQIFPPGGLDRDMFDLSGDRHLCLKILALSEDQPAVLIESLPNYLGLKPNLELKQNHVTHIHDLKIRDLMDMGYDPTRFKMAIINDKEYLFERIKTDDIPAIREKQQLLGLLLTRMENTKAKGAHIRVAPPLVVIRDNGNAYVMRRKISGIPWDEAMKEIKTNIRLKSLNRTIHLERLIQDTVQSAARLLITKTGVDKHIAFENITWLLSWNIRNNHPSLMVDYTGSFFETVWIV